MAKKKIAKERTTKIGAATLFTVAMIFNVTIAQAREMGHYAPGVVSIRDLAVPRVPGFFYAQYNAYYSADSYGDGTGFLWSTSKKILGANYAFYVVPQVGESSLSAKLSVLDQVGKNDDDSIGIGDTYVQPIWLG